MAEYIIYYAHTDCKIQPGIQWVDTYDCVVNGECPVCGMDDIVPKASREIETKQSPHDLRCSVCCVLLNEQCLDPQCQQIDNHVSDQVCTNCDAPGPGQATTTELENEEKRFHFHITVGGWGKTPEEAWEDCKEEVANDGLGDGLPEKWEED